MTGGWYRPTR